MTATEVALAVVAAATVLVAAEMTLRRRATERQLMEAAAWSMVDPASELLTPPALDRRRSMELRRADREHSVLVELALPHANTEQGAGPGTIAEQLAPGQVGGRADDGSIRILLLDPADPGATQDALTARLDAAGVDVRNASARQLAPAST